MKQALLRLTIAVLVPALGPCDVAAGDSTLGTTTQPTGSSTSACAGANYEVVETATDQSSPPYLVPLPGGVITRWSTDASGASPGSQVSLVVLRPGGASSYTVLAVDTETLPMSLPPTNVATFVLATPIPVNAGDSIAISGPFTSLCGYSGGAIPAGDQFADYSSSPAAPPAPGQTIKPAAGTLMFALVNVSAVVSTRFDTALSTSSAPVKPRAGALALLSSTVTNQGPATQPITFVDDVPPGLKIISALAGSGSCAVSGQTVTCTISGLATGASAPISIVVTPPNRGSYTNHVNVSPPPGFTDPTPGDNSAATTLSVTNAGPTGCVVPRLRGAPVSVAKRTLKLLGCRVKIKRKTGRAIPKGAVLKTKPGPGNYAFAHRITLIVRK